MSTTLPLLVTILLLHRSWPVRIKNGRGERIRTSDPHNPIVVRYQAALRPDRVFRAPERQVVLAAQDVKKLLEFHTYLLDDLLTLRDIRLRMFASQPLSCATNRKTIIIQEATYLTNDQNVLKLIITTIAAPFHRF